MSYPRKHPSDLQASDQYPHSCNYCGKAYAIPHHLDAHQRLSCTGSKRSLGELLARSKMHWESRKRRRTFDSSAAAVDRCSREGADGPRNTGGDSERRGSGATTNSHADESPPCEPQIQTPPIPLPEAPVIPEPAPPLAEVAQSPLARRKAKRSARPPPRYCQPDSVASTRPLNDFGPIVPVGSTIDLSFLPASLKEIRTLVVHETGRDSFGILKRYRTSDNANPLARGPKPSAPVPAPTPDQNARQSGTEVQEVPKAPFGPFRHQTGFLLAEWYWNSTNKSFLDFQKLVGIMSNPQFSVSDATSINWRAAFKELGTSPQPQDHDAPSFDTGWKTTPVSIKIPFHSKTKDPGTKSYTLGTFRHRSLVSVIKEKLSRHKDHEGFDYYPHIATWKRMPDSADTELYGELYASRAFRKLHEYIQQQPSTAKNKGMERVIVALMFWSDATLLTSFGGASLWPCYLFFGNESKYRRARPSERLGYQVAYFMKLPDTLNDHLKDRNEGKLPTDPLFTYCSRVLFHKLWSILLDEEFQLAVKEGIVLPCPDGNPRCFYPRIVTYAADYPEKMLVAGLRNNGLRPCHRCLIGKSDIFRLGVPSGSGSPDILQRDLVQEEETISHCRKEIKKGYAVNSSTFEEQLKAFSLYPVENAFSNCISLDIRSTLVVDILHEFEIGVWKRLYIHLMRLLSDFDAERGITLTAELDSRYRSMPAFGRDKVRKFPLNASEMRRKAARDFENLLQCAIPAFESLLPEPHDSILMTLLYICAQWHALAKLRLHNDFTLALLEYNTACLGAQMRLFDRETCSQTVTRELPREAEARARRETKNGKGPSNRKPIRLGMYTIKFHFLGDYASVIQRFGTTDSYSTQTGELYHRVPKSWYPRTDRKDYEAQLSKIERRQAQLSQIRANLDGPLDAKPPGKQGAPQGLGDGPPVQSHYTIGANQNRPLRLDSFASRVSDLDFIPRLKRHLLPRVLKSMSCPDKEAPKLQHLWPHVVLRENRLYGHQILRVAYDTYDVKEDEDTIHVGTPQSNIMMHNRRFTKETRHLQHPYLYANVIGVFHADVSFIYRLPSGIWESDYSFHRLDFVWVHWYDFQASSGEFALDKVAHAPAGTAFGFVDPDDIIRGVHLIPQFAQGKESPPLQDQCSEFVPKHTRWSAYYINKFADRDAFMRYQFGMSVGHTYMQGEAFPPPHIPSVPEDIDWCLNVQGNVDDNEEGQLEQEEAGSGEWNDRGELRDFDDRDFEVFDDMDGGGCDRGY